MSCGRMDVRAYALTGAGRTLLMCRTLLCGPGKYVTIEMNFRFLCVTGSQGMRMSGCACECKYEIHNNK